jgi:hypothetical protein
MEAYGNHYRVDDAISKKLVSFDSGVMTRPQVPCVTQKGSKELDLQKWLEIWCRSPSSNTKRGRGVVLEAPGLE